MKFTLSWLKDHLETDATLVEITDKLTAIGLELEEVEDRATDLAPFTVTVDAQWPLYGDETFTVFRLQRAN